MHYPASTQLAHWTFPASPAVLPETTLLVDKLARLVPLLLPAHPIRCTLTALAYVRRFFVHVSPDDADGLIVVLCAIYVAGKVEELPTPAGYLGNQRGVHVQQLVESVQRLARKDPGLAVALDASARRTRRSNTEQWCVDIVQFEMVLLQGLRFELVCYHPLRPALGVIEAAGWVQDAELVRRTRALCVQWYLCGDWMLTVAPAKLGAAAVLAAMGDGDPARGARVLEVLPDLFQVPKEKCRQVPALAAALLRNAAPS